MNAFPYVSILLAVVLIYIPRGFVVRAQAAEPGGLDNAHPRAQQAGLTGRGARALGAHQNAFESFGPFAVGVLACEQRHVEPSRIAIACAIYLLARSVYLILYLGNLPTARSAVWGIGFLTSLALLIMASTESGITFG